MDADSSSAHEASERKGTRQVPYLALSRLNSLDDRRVFGGIAVNVIFKICWVLRKRSPGMGKEYELSLGCAGSMDPMLAPVAVFRGHFRFVRRSTCIAARRVEEVRQY